MICHIVVWYTARNRPYSILLVAEKPKRLIWFKIDSMVIVQFAVLASVN